MGTDIHPYAEMRINDKWYYAGHIGLDRDYCLFGIMAGVRGREGMIVEPRGLPSDCSAIVKLYSDEQDGHTHSYLSIQELDEVKDTYEDLVNEKLNRSLTDLQQLFSVPGVEDVRLVFWFDS